MPRGQIKLTDDDKQWAKEVKERDGWRCVVCGDILKLNSHHLIPRENHATKYLLDNGLTLCSKHHLFSREISAHNNPLALFCWMEKHRPMQLEMVKRLINENSMG